MDDSVLVSVIIPVYNVLPFLVETLDSVINQTYTNLEIIIIDDGSTDGSGDICDEYAIKDRRIHVIHQKNEGLSVARNKGLEIMSGQAVVFLDSDDAYHPNFIREMISSLLRESVDLVVCKFTTHETTGKMRHNYQDKHYPNAKAGFYDRVSALHLLVDRSINPGVWNKIYKSELWRNIRYPIGKVYKKIEILYRIVNKCNSVFVFVKP